MYPQILQPNSSGISAIIYMKLRHKAVVLGVPVVRQRGFEPRRWFDIEVLNRARARAESA
jgi:hypothetical protein